VHLVGRYSNRVELSGQLSNRAIEARINALWSLARDNVSTQPWAHNSPVFEPTLRTPKRVCRRLDRAKVEELIHGYVDGVPVDELAARFQVDQSTVQKHAGRHGLPRRSPRLGPRQSEEAARLYLAGHSLAKLASTFGVATDTVACALRRAGVALRPRRGGPFLAGRPAGIQAVALTESESVTGWVWAGSGGGYRGDVSARIARSTRICVSYGINKLRVISR